jgi:hypothetical protein
VILCVFNNKKREKKTFRTLIQGLDHRFTRFDNGYNTPKISHAQFPSRLELAVSSDIQKDIEQSDQLVLKTGRSSLILPVILGIGISPVLYKITMVFGIDISSVLYNKTVVLGVLYHQCYIKTIIMYL